MPTREEMQDLAQNIVNSHEDRTKRIAQLQEDVNGLKKAVSVTLNGYGKELNRVHSARVSAGKELRDDLAKSAANLRQDMDSMLREFDKDLKKVRAVRTSTAKELRANLSRGAATLREDVEGMRKEFDQSLKDTHAARVAEGNELRGELAKSAASLRKDVDALLGGFDAVLEDVQRTRAGGREEWQKLTATMQAKRKAGVKPQTKPESPTEDAMPKTQAATVDTRVFEYLANHPDGTKLNELEKGLGLARVQISRATHDLLEKNKAEKRGPLYFAI